MLQSTLRDVQAALTTPVALTGMAVVALILGLSGPFGTFAALAPGPRMAYWAAIVVATYAVGTFGATLAGSLMPARWPPALRVPVAGVAAGVPVTAVVLFINTISFAGDAARTPGPLFLMIFSIAVATGAVLIATVLRRSRAASAPDATTPTDAALLARLPVTARAPLVRLSMQDHYVEVETLRGTTLVLMRMADAIRETDGVAGLRIHRSHWVALDQVRRVRRAGGKVLVETVTGAELPISRSFMPAAREAGLVPQ